MIEPTEELLAAQRDLDAAAQRAAELAEREQNAGTELARVGAGKDAAQLREEMQEIRTRMERTQREVERAADRVKREIQRQADAMNRQLQSRLEKANAALAPVKKQLELMAEGIETITLYLNAAKNAVTIRDGQRASDIEPIVIRQMVLAMDEETGMFAEDGGITAQDLDAFDEWLLADPEHVTQIIPETKGVVALVARWRERERGNPWSRDRDDVVTHFLVRNGDALFRTSVDFVAGEALIPRADEFVAFFRTSQFNFGTRQDEVTVLQPGTETYAQAMEQADKRSRHFLRIGLILQGLVDNSDVFAPLHPAGVNMLTDPSERSEKVRIITDAEGGLESGAETFLQWQERVNAQLRPGMRIIGAFSGEAWRDANEWDRRDRSGHSRCHPAGWNWEAPPSGVPLLVEDRRPDGGLVIRYEREREIFDTSINEPVPDKPGYVYRGKHRKPKTRASCVIYPNDTFVLPYDLIESSDQMRAFLGSRRNRRDYQDLWPLVRSAMFAKRAEEEAEAPFRTMLAGVLARENDVTVDQAQADIDDLVRWFKLKNRWARPLTLETMVGIEASERIEAEAAAAAGRTAGGRRAAASLGMREGLSARTARDVPDVEHDPQAYQDALEAQELERLAGREHEAKAVRMIVDEHRRRVADRRRPLNEQVVARLRAKHPQALLIARPRRGGYLVLLAADPHEDVYVHELEYTAKGSLRNRHDWKLVGADRPTRWTIAHAHPRWEHWNTAARAADYLTGPERDQLAQQLADAARQKGNEPMMISYLPPTATTRSRLVCWAMTGDGVADLDHPLTTEPERPGYVANVRGWRRDGTSIMPLRSGSWYEKDDLEWSTDTGDRPPWTGEYARAYAGRAIWGPDPDVMARWTAATAAYLRASERRSELRKVTYAAADSIRKQWRALRVNELYDAFMAEVPDADWHEWAEHLKSNPPDWPYQDSHHHAHGAVGALAGHLLERDVDPSGMTVVEALELARAEHDLPDTWRGFGSRTHPFELGDDIAALVFGADPVDEPVEETHADRSEAQPAEEPAEADARVVADFGDFDVVIPEEDEEPEDDDPLRALRDVFK